VHPGNTFSSGVGIEVSMTQRWVLATDIVYKMQARTKFQGTTVAPVGGGFSDQLSLAPAIEYNWSPNLGAIVGAWFSVYGRNSPQFASGVCSLTYTFPI
jgi:hypothetical protein